MLCVMLICVALISLSVYELCHAESDRGHVLPHPEQVVEKDSVKKPGFAVYGRNVSVYYFRFKTGNSYLFLMSCLCDNLIDFISFMADIHFSSFAFSHRLFCSYFRKLFFASSVVLS